MACGGAEVAAATTASAEAAAAAAASAEAAAAADSEGGGRGDYGGLQLGGKGPPHSLSNGGGQRVEDLPDEGRLLGIRHLLNDDKALLGATGDSRIGGNGLLGSSQAGGGAGTCFFFWLARAA